jgi:drug/metabolite transporter (DMT)-like permease
MTAESHRSRVALCFGLVYVLWGSTYLAMRIAVRDFPPYVAGAVRYLAAGPIMLGVCALAGRRVRISRQDLVRLLGIAVLLLCLGNIGVLWGEEYVASGFAALIVALLPIWVVIIETWILRDGRMSRQGFIGLAFGILGLLILLWPRLTAGTHLGHLELIGTGILGVGSFCWALGSVFSSRWDVSVGVFASAAWQMTLAGFVNAAVAALTGQFRHARWTAPAFESVGYLVIFGSWIGYSAYIWLLEHVPTPKVATYTYINPIVALFLGWLLLKERVDGYMLVGTAIIIGSVALVNSSKLRPRSSQLGEPDLSTTAR